MTSTDLTANFNDAPAKSAGILGGLSAYYLFGVLLRNWYWPLAGGLLGILAALTYISSSPNQFKSTARILIDQSVNRYLQVNKVSDGPTLAENEAGSQIYVLSSESIILPVVRSLGLAHDTEFVGALAGGEVKSTVSLSGFISALKRAISLGPAAAKPTDEVLERIAVEEFVKRLTVEHAEVASVMNVSFLSDNAQKAANIANAIAKQYISTSMEVKSKSTKLATDVLRSQLTDLKRQALEADRALQDYMLTNGLEVSSDGSGNAKRLLVLNEQLSIARATLAEAKARIEYIKQNEAKDALSPQVGDNEVILRLRFKYLELTSRITDFEGRLGKTHAVVNKLRLSLKDIEVAIEDEKKRVSDGYVRDYVIAKARNEKIIADLAQAVLTTGGADSKIKVTVADLRSNAESLRDAYSAALLRFNETNKISDAAGQDARVITEAAPPLTASSKKHTLALAGGVSLGLLLGLLSVLARELASTTVRVPNQVRQFTDAYCALLPVGKLQSKLLPIRRKNRAVNIEDYVLDAHFSRFTEVFRNLRAVLVSRREQDSSTVVGVVSAVAGEGKSVVASNLASLLASGTKHRVLVIDARLYNASLTKRLARKAEAGLGEALKDPSRLASLVVKTERAGFDLLPCPAGSRNPNAADMLGSSQLDGLIAEARKNYDFIIIEASPIMSVADVKMIDRHVDQYVLVVKWDATDRRLIEEALIEVEGMHDRLSCVVVNKVNPAELKYIDAHKGRGFGDQYEG